ncbi:hypothetical protein Syun_012725 [Stephania yunnanensis]|uniref:Secreted protein n=1 Tax=Stephania yunnanensis TaxID=152371 RepID=A0AAP0K264_9MAGN
MAATAGWVAPLPLIASFNTMVGLPSGAAPIVSSGDGVAAMTVSPPPSTMPPGYRHPLCLLSHSTYFLFSTNNPKKTQKKRGNMNIILFMDSFTLDIY